MERSFYMQADIHIYKIHMCKIPRGDHKLLDKFSDIENRLD